MADFGSFFLNGGQGFSFVLYEDQLGTLYWYGQLSWTQPSGLYLCVCVCVFLCVRSLFGVTSSNVELPNYVISRQIVIERRVT